MREISQFNPWKMDLTGFKENAGVQRPLEHSLLTAASLLPVCSRVLRVYKPERLCLNLYYPEIY